MKIFGLIQMIRDLAAKWHQTNDRRPVQLRHHSVSSNSIGHARKLLAKNRDPTTDSLNDEFGSGLSIHVFTNVGPEDCNGARFRNDLTIDLPSSVPANDVSVFTNAPAELTIAGNTLHANFEYLDTGQGITIVHLDPDVQKHSNRTFNFSADVYNASDIQSTNFSRLDAPSSLREALRATWYVPLTAFLGSVAFFLFFFLPATRHQWLQLSIYSLFTTLSAALAAGLLVLPTSALRRQRSEVNNVLKESTELPRTTHNIPDLNLDGFDRIAGKLGTQQD